MDHVNGSVIELTDQHLAADFKEEMGRYYDESEYRADKE